MIGVHPVHHSLVDDGLDLRDGVVNVVEECLHRSLILSTQNTALLLPITGASKSCQPITTRGVAPINSFDSQMHPETTYL